MPVSYIPGKSCKIYFHATPSTALSSMTAVIDCVGDVSINSTKATSPISSRESNGWETVVPGNRTLTVSFQIVEKPDDSAYAALRNSYYGLNSADEEFTMAVLTGLKTVDGVRGHRFNGTVTQWNEGEPLNGAKTADVTISLTEYLAFEEIEV